MRTQESSIAGSKGVRLHTVEWLPDSGTPIVADVLLVHGYAEHAGRYAPVAGLLTAAGMRVAALDLRGHGRSTGVKKGVVDHFSAVVDDVAAYAREVRTDRPLVLYGHSMGGLASVLLAERDESMFAGLVITSALLAPADSIPPALVKVANVLGRYASGMPTIKLDADTISRDHTEVEIYLNDPLNYTGRVTAGTGREMNLARVEALGHAARITKPILIMHGTADQLTSFRGSEQLYERVSSLDKTIRLWPGAYHELQHEPERGEVLEMIRDWIVAHI